MATTVTVSEERRDELRRFKEMSGSETYDAAVDELLSIAAIEGYWDTGDDEEPTIASADEVDDVTGRVATLEEQVEALREVVAELRPPANR